MTYNVFGGTLNPAQPQLFRQQQDLVTCRKYYHISYHSFMPFLLVLCEFFFISNRIE